jgi:hypothetical protein
MKKRAGMLALIVLVIGGLMLTPSVAQAKAGDVIKTGSCSAGSTWKLKLSPENGQIEVDFEVDSNVVGQTWRVRLRHNGEVFFRGTRTTQPPSGSFEVHRVAPNAAGTDTFAARAVNPDTGETCVAHASF